MERSRTEWRVKTETECLVLQGTPMSLTFHTPNERLGEQHGRGGGENVRAGGWGECWEMLSSAHAVTISLRNSWPKIKGLKFWHNTVDNLRVPPPIGESWQLITVMVSYRTAGWTWILSIVSASLHWSISGRWHLILWMSFLLPIKWGD